MYTETLKEGNPMKRSMLELRVAEVTALRSTAGGILLSVSKALLRKASLELEI